MRIVHLLLTSRFAGTERHALELAAAQAEAGHDVTLVLRRAGAQARPDAIAQRVDSKVKVELIGNLFTAWQARRLLQRLQPDVAHAHLSKACHALHGLHGSILRVATLHIRYKPGQHRGLDGLIAIAPWQLEAIPEPLRSRSVQIDNWTLPHASTSDARRRLRATHGIDNDTILFGALGRVEHSKGLDILIEAFRRAALPNARLAIVGQGREWKRLRALADDGVIMPGFTDTPQDWLAAFDIFVSAARSEPFGLVLLEAMQAGLPIVASTSEGARHLAAEIRNPLVAVDDPAALAIALARICNERHDRTDYAMERFRIEAKLPQVEAFYRAGLSRIR